MQESITRHLAIQLEHSTKGEEDGCPLIAPQAGVNALHAHCLLASREEPQNNFELYCQQVWELCVALWGNLPTLSPEGRFFPNLFLFQGTTNNYFLILLCIL